MYICIILQPVLFSKCKHVQLGDPNNQSELEGSLSESYILVNNKCRSSPLGIQKYCYIFQYDG